VRACTETGTSTGAGQAGQWLDTASLGESKGQRGGGKGDGWRKESPLWALGWGVAGWFGQIPVGMGLRGWEKGRWVAARCTDVQGPANRRPATSAMVWVWAELGLRIRFEVCARGCAFFSLLAA